MVKPLLFALLGTVALSFMVGSRSPSEPLHLAEDEGSSSQITLGGEPLRDIVPLSSVIVRQAERPVEAIRMTQIRAIRSEGQQSVLIFDDGSELAVTSYVLDALPHDLRLRLSYER